MSNAGTTKQHHLPVSVIYFFGALGGLLFGYDTGVISGAMLFIGHELNIANGSFQYGFLTASTSIGAVFGAFFIGPLSDRFGRRHLLITAAIIFFFAALGSAFSPEYIALVSFRFCLGIAVGAASSLIPTYLAELAPAERRGTVGSLFQLMVMTGIFFAYVFIEWFSPQGGLNLSESISWRWMLGLAAVPAAILWIGAIFLPESPRVLVRKHDEKTALAVLRQFNPDEKVVQKDLSDIKAQAAIPSGGWKELFGPVARPVLVMACGLAILQQVMGCNTVLYYAPTIFISAGFSTHFALQSHIVIGIFNVIVTAIAVSIMDKINRKTMLIGGAVGMAASLFIMSTAMLLLHAGNGNLGSWICVIALTLYIAFFSATWGPVMWLMIGEAFPLNIRGLGNSFGAAVNWFANFCVAETFTVLLVAFEPKGVANPEGQGIARLFIVYGLFCVLAIWFVHKKAIETRHRTLEDIESGLRQRAADKGYDPETGELKK